MKKAILPLIVLTSVLASCGTSPIATTSAENTNTFNSTAEVPSANPALVAQYLVNAGFTKEDAQRIKDNLPKVKALNQQSSSSISNRNIDITKESMDMILNDSVTKKSTAMSSQAVTRSLVVNAANNISLYSMENFRYYQSQNYLGNSTPYNLDYTDDGCSAPQPIFFFTNFQFYDACDQHDFGYRNGLFSELHNPSFKQAVDTRFYNNMIILCNTYYSGFNNGTCRAEAAGYYTAVVAPIVTAYWLSQPNK